MKLTKVKFFFLLTHFEIIVTGSCKNSTERSYVPFIYFPPVVMSCMMIACYKQDLTLEHNHYTDSLISHAVMAVWVDVCVCMCVWVWVCVYIYVCVCVCVYVCACKAKELSWK